MADRLCNRCDDQGCECCSHWCSRCHQWIFSPAMGDHLRSSHNLSREDVDKFFAEWRKKNGIL